MSKSKAKGTKWESDIVDYLRANGFPHVERRALHGTNDKGDIAGIPGVVIECKNQSRLSLAEWVDEAETEAHNDAAEVGMVWHKRRGFGSPGRAYVTMTGEQVAWLLRAAGYGTPL